MSGSRVLVAGASIAGPALAHWLRRRGAEVTGVERAPELRPGGQAVDVDGNVLETFRADGDGGDGFIADIEILRGDLSQVLHDDTRDGVEYVFGDRIAELTQDADGVDVAFAGGRVGSRVRANGVALLPGPHSGGLRCGAHLVWLTECPCGCALRTPSPTIRSPPDFRRVRHAR